MIDALDQLLMVAGEVSINTGKWVAEKTHILENPSHQNINEALSDNESNGYIANYDPLLKLLLESEDISWCVVGMKVALDFDQFVAKDQDNYGFRFWTKFGDETIDSSAKQIAKSIGDISTRAHCGEPYRMFLTTALVVNILTGDEPLVINMGDTSAGQARANTISDQESEIENVWEMDVRPCKPVVDWVVREIGDEIKRLIQAENLDETVRLLSNKIDNCPEEISRCIVGLPFSLYSPSDVNRYTNGERSITKARKAIINYTTTGDPNNYKTLCKYLILMTLITPEWKRIWMIPQVGASTQHTRPGGMILCQTTEEGVPARILKKLSYVISIPMWPWSSLLARKQGFSLLKSLMFDGADIPLFKVLQLKENDYSSLITSFSAKYGYEINPQIKVADSQLLENLETVELRTRLRKSARQEKFQLSRNPEFISIIVPARGRKSVFKHCLVSLLNQSYVQAFPDQCEIVIVEDGIAFSGDTKGVWGDDGKSIIDEWVEKLCECELVDCTVKTITLGEQYGRCTARNVGLSVSKESEYVFFIDSSMILDPHFVSEHLARHRLSSGPIAVQGFYAKALIGEEKWVVEEIEKDTATDLFENTAVKEVLDDPNCGRWHSSVFLQKNNGNLDFAWKAASIEVDEVQIAVSGRQIYRIIGERPEQLGGIYRGSDFSDISFLKHNVDISVQEAIKSCDDTLKSFSPGPMEDWKMATIVKGCEGTRELSEFVANGKAFTLGDDVFYMEMTNYLLDMSGEMAFGYRNLPSFFQTNLVSVKKSMVVEAGGFDPFLEPLWGFEDSHLGTQLVCNGVKIVPCADSTAYKVEHDGSSTEEELEIQRKFYYTSLLREASSGSGMSILNGRLRYKLSAPDIKMLNDGVKVISEVSSHAEEITNE